MIRLAKEPTSSSTGRPKSSSGSQSLLGSPAKAVLSRFGSSETMSASCDKHLPRSHTEVRHTALMAILGLHRVHLAMPPGGEAEAPSFYEGLLGVPRVAKPPHLEARGGCWFESASTRIHLGVELNFTPLERPTRHCSPTTWQHFASTSNLPVSGSSRTNRCQSFERFYVSDPFGNRN